MMGKKQDNWTQHPHQLFRKISGSLAAKRPSMFNKVVTAAAKNNTMSKSCGPVNQNNELKGAVRSVELKENAESVR